MKKKTSEDYIIRGTACNNAVRVFAMTSREIVETAANAHGTGNVVTAALGRLLTAGALMGSMMKNDTDVLTLRIESDGPVQGITVTAGVKDSAVYVKGYPVVSKVDIPLKKNGKLDVGTAVGKGMLTVIKDMGLKEPFAGSTELVSGEIAEDLTYYFASSEQVPSSVALGVLVSPDGAVLKAGGFIIQLLPFATDEVIAKLEERLGKIRSVTSMLADGMTPEAILETVFEGMDLRIYDRIEAGFVCDCSKERVTKALLSIGSNDLKEMIADGKPIETNCRFCGKTYSFDTVELEQIFEAKKKKAVEWHKQAEKKKKNAEE